MAHQAASAGATANAAAAATGPMGSASPRLPATAALFPTGGGEGGGAVDDGGCTQTASEYGPVSGPGALAITVLTRKQLLKKSDSIGPVQRNAAAVALEAGTVPASVHVRGALEPIAAVARSTS